MLLEGVTVKGALKNILLTHCRRKNQLAWYTKRFGEVSSESFPLKGKQGSNKNIYEKVLADTHLDWALDGEPLSIVSEAKKKRDADNLNYEDHLRSLEKKYLVIPLKPEHRKAMLGSQKEFAKIKGEGKKLAQSIPVKKKPKKVDKKEKDKVKPKRVMKKKKTEKDSKSPRAHFNLKS